MNAAPAEFAGTVGAVTQAVAAALAQLEAVLAVQRREIVALAATGGRPPVEARSRGSADPAAAVEAVLKSMPGETCPEGAAAGEPGAVAQAAIVHAAAHAITLALYNTVAAQQQLNVLAQAVTAQAAAAVLGARTSG